ncbi:MAG: lactonase family protein [Undibacterium sp.]|nr:lactonase family protein [Opitutaceae bacterium]
MPLRLAPIAALLLALLAPAAAAPAEFFVYFGTYTKAPSQGIYRSRLDVATGRLSPVELAATAQDPAFLALHPNGRFLYAIDESSAPQRTPTTGLSAYALDPTTGTLQLLNQQTPGDSGPCHLTVDATGRSLLVANYGGGSVSAIALQPDGRLGAPGSVIKHTGSSVNLSRQKAPHAHAIVLSPDNRFAFTPDLGIDRVVAYQLDPASARLTPAPTASTTVPPGSGPRHLTFHPTGRFAYVINELLCTMTTFAYAPAAGALTAVQTISTLPPGESTPKGTSTAEVQVHPSGKFLYGSNRGANTIVVYAIAEKTGQLTYVDTVPTRGKTPRHFALDPTGTWLLAENQDSNTVAIFRIDQTSGRLTPTGPLLEVPSPVCAVFVAVR